MTLAEQRIIGPPTCLECFRKHQYLQPDFFFIRWSRYILKVLNIVADNVSVRNHLLLSLSIDDCCLKPKMKILIRLVLRHWKCFDDICYFHVFYASVLFGEDVDVRIPSLSTWSFGGGLTGIILELILDDYGD